MKDVKEVVLKALKAAFEERQNAPNQYVVVYKRIDNDETIGYHADTACSVVSDILHGKRYSGEDPYPQLAIIAKNLKYAMSNPKYIEHFMPDVTPENVYIDAVYLAEGTPKQNFQIKIIEPNGTKDNQGEGTGSSQ